MTRRIRATALGQWSFVCLGILLHSSSAPATTFHVATTGDNSFNGSAATPWLTIQRCADAAQPGDICRVHAGTYRETVTPPRSGIAGEPIRFEAAPGECVTVSGTDVLTGVWTSYSGSIWSMPTSSRFIQLFSGGTMLNEARWPNADPADLVHMPTANADAGSDANGLVATGAPPGDWAGAMVLVLPGLQWWSYTRHITAYDQVSQRLTFDNPVSDPSLVPKQNSRYYLFGSLLALDSEGEWFLDAVTSKLYLWPPAGVNPGSLSVEVKQRTWTFDVTNQSYVEIAGFQTFAGAIRLNNASHCTVDGVRGKYMSAMRETNGWTVVPDVPSIVGDFNVWKNSIFAFSAASGLFVHGNDNLVANNIVHDVDTVGLQRAGIEYATWDTNARNVIAYNTIFRSGWAGIAMTGAANSRTLFNRITDASLLVNDAGSLYAGETDGKASEIAFNEISGAPCVYCTGVYLDDGTRNFVVHHNYLHDLNWFGASFKNQNAFFNNTVRSAGHAALIMAPNYSVIPPAWDAVSSAMVFNNLLDGSTDLSVWLRPASVTDYSGFSAPVLASDEWQHVEVPFSSLTQPPAGNPESLDLRVAQELYFQVESPGDFSVEIDNLRLEGPTPKPFVDFEGGFETTLGTTWSAGASNGSSVSLEREGPGAACAGDAAELAGTELVDGGVWTGSSLSLLPNGTADLSAYTGISFDVRARSRFWMSTLFTLTNPISPVQGFNVNCPVDMNQVPTSDCAIGKSQPIAGYVAAGTDLGAFQSGSTPWTAGAQFSETPASCNAVPDVVMNLPPSAPYPETPTGPWPAPLPPDPRWAPEIVVPASASPGQVDLTASVAGHAGSAYSWSITNGTITGGQGSNEITFTAGIVGTLTLSVVEVNDGCASPVGRTPIQITAVGALAVYTVSPTSGPASGYSGAAVAGVNFAAGDTALIGGVAASGVLVGSPSQITMNVPALAAGAVYPVTVADPHSGSGTLTNGWLADFLDVPGLEVFHPFVEKLVRSAITSGCGGGHFCPASSTTRAQMAVFLLRSINGPSYTPPPCALPFFADVPCSSGFSTWINELARRGVTAGCGAGNYCPEASVTRGQMAVFLLRTEGGPAYKPPACTFSAFADVPCSSGLAIWINELAARGTTVGCGAGNYCPDDVVTRGQMSVFLSKTFALP